MDKVLLVLCLSLASVHCASSPLYFQRIFVIALSHLNVTQTNDANWISLISKGQLLSNDHAVSSTAQANYLAIIGGSTFNVTSDADVDIASSNLVDLLESANVTWKAYMEDYPGGCDNATSVNLYVRAHNPFISFTNIRTDVNRCAKIVNASGLDTDIVNNQVPQFAFYTPNTDNSGSTTNTTTSGMWLNNFLSTKLNNSNFINNTLVVVTFDFDPAATDNAIFSLLFGPYITQGSTNNATYDHYSLLRTIETNWVLANLTAKDVTAVPYSLNLINITTTTTGATTSAAATSGGNATSTTASPNTTTTSGTTTSGTATSTGQAVTTAGTCNNFFQQCVNTCNPKPVSSCSCVNGQGVALCGTTSGSVALSAISLALIFSAIFCML